MKILIILAAILTLSGCSGPRGDALIRAFQGMGQAFQGNRYENQARAQWIDAQNRQGELDRKLAAIEYRQRRAEAAAQRAAQQKFYSRLNAQMQRNRIAPMVYKPITY